MLELTQEQTKYTIDVLKRESTRLISEIERTIRLFRDGDFAEQPGIDITKANLSELDSLLLIVAQVKLYHTRQRYGCIPPSQQKQINRWYEKDRKYVKSKRVELEGIIAKQQILPL